ncbi:PRAME family member 12-like isoform X2 [Cavia porcellus]|uniref:PRAME family member 12-like isoform X2 n=1 Tax=Cavia porcellus TaxID=10141 RepID=UPI000661A560|nr:PRAME family member 12-like isoform X1 [Cavia porcellus]XP_023422742.1 PRAME family member 12-like isoform X1 [Cavia porcellus]
MLGIPWPCRSSRMRPRSPPTLLQLAVRGLLRHKAVALGALEDLPGDLFPPIFAEAFAKGHVEVLKAMVLSWPFPCLPLGALMEAEGPELFLSLLGSVQVPRRRNWQVLQAVLDGLDQMLNREVSSRSRRLKLRAVDARCAQQGLPKVWAGSLREAGFWEIPKRRRTAKRPLTMVLDIWIQEGFLSEFSSQLLRWTKERRGLVQLDCVKLHITAKKIQSITESLATVDLSRVQEADMNFSWALSTLFIFSHYLSYMPNLRKLRICDCYANPLVIPEENKSFITDFATQFLKLHSLREICLDSIFFLEDHLAQVLRRLVLPLETLTLVRCQLSPTDWEQLPQYPSTRHLTHLGLCGVRLTDFSPGPLQSLLANTAATLTSLHLEACGITEAQLHAILPALSRCTQLSALRYLQNSLSIDGLEQLLGHTSRLSNLSLELYEVPTEMYGPSSTVLQRDRACHELRRVMTLLQHPRTVWFSGLHCRLRENWEPHSLHCTPCPACVPI